MIVQGQPVAKTFFQESEWRYLAINDKLPLYLKKELFNDTTQKDEANNSAALHGALRFNPQDVKYLFVKDESDIPDLVNFVNSELNMYPQRDVQTLLTRIVSQDTIENDI